MATLKAIFLAAAATSLLTACVPAFLAQRANDLGNIAYFKQQYDDALAKYQRSLALADQIGDKELSAVAMYGLARTYAQLCQVSNADKWFKQSISVRETLRDTHYAYITQNFLEYGRFLDSQSRQSEAVKLYERALSALESMGMEQKDPMQFALVLDEYEVLLLSTGRKSDASAVAARAKSLRETYKGLEPPPKWERYPTCTEEQRER